MSEVKHYDVSMTLNGTESRAFEAYCKKTGCSYTGAFICLIREHLMAKPTAPEELVFSTYFDDRISALEEQVEVITTCTKYLSTKNEKLEEEIAFLQLEVSKHLKSS